VEPSHQNLIQYGMKILSSVLASACLIAFASMSVAQTSQPAQSPQPAASQPAASQPSASQPAAPAAQPGAAASKAGTASTAQTANLSPEDLVKKVTADVLETIKSDKQLAAGDKNKALQLAEEKILPHVDFKEAARLAVGRPWSQATPEQQEKLTSAFRQMLVRSYSNALESYQGQTVKVLPSRTAPNSDTSTVRNQYIRQGGAPVTLEYAMKKNPDGWKIYDITVEGISLVLTYRGQFEQVAKQSGIDGLIKAMNEKNTPAIKPS
jgi:phospholipid transport system substrate-binding protein